MDCKVLLIKKPESKFAMDCGELLPSLNTIDSTLLHFTVGKKSLYKHP